MREGRYDSAFDRIYIAFSDYIRHLLKEHDVAFDADDSLTALFMKLQDHYCSHIRPEKTGDGTKTILQGAGEIIDTINGLKNDNAEAQADGQLIEKREVQFALGLINSTVEYIEDVEKEYG